MHTQQMLHEERYQGGKRGTRQFWSQLRDELVGLEFLSRFFSWFFMLLSRLAEPLMLVAILYIVIEAGVSRLAVAALHETAVAIMISAPEIILPGAFAMAAQSRAAGKPCKLLYAVSWCFVALTGVTLLSLFVFHLDAAAWSVVTFLRCGAGVGYSILIRVLSHGQGEAPNVRSPDLLARIEALAEHLQRASASTERGIGELSARLAERDSAFAAGVRSLGETLPGGLAACLGEHLQPLGERMRESVLALAAIEERMGQLEGRLIAGATPTTKRPGEREQARGGSEQRQTKANTPPNVRSLTRRPERRTTTATSGSIAADKGAFVRTCLSEQPELSNSDIGRKAAESGVRISPAYISETKKAFLLERHHSHAAASPETSLATTIARAARKSAVAALAEEGTEAEQQEEQDRGEEDKEETA